MINWNEICKTLKEANQYDSVVGILSRILFIADNYLPVKIYIDENGKPTHHVNISKVKAETALLLSFLYNPKLQLEYTVEPDCMFEHLNRYISNSVDVRLHNYANSISYRKEPEGNMDNIRSYCVLNNLLDNISYVDDKWTIPEGWKLEGK